ncbi:hypothetical protein [Halorubrum aethiopicum]|uniref:hypothetical protein n=1 Tax=Halorubrum aethiopicum TaxID=1758255 RepID=UPI000A48CFED|nr:hypothetical protein [Halorubrum aethiopicum]
MDDTDFDVADAAQELERKPTTQSGSVRKNDAMAWLKGLDTPSDDELISAVTHKPDEFSGSTFATPVSQVRVTGDSTFISAVAGLLKPLLVWESSATRLDLKVQQVEDRETGELTDNYALYLGAAERGGQGKIASALMGTNKENDRKLLEALDDM